MNPENQAFELQPIVEAIYSAKTSREMRIRQVVHLLKDYPEQAVIEAISDLIFRYQEYVQARARPRPTIHFINTNFMSDISCRKPDTALSSLESKRCSKPANLASTPANLASTPANLASMSLRKSPISRRTSAKPCSMSRRTSTTSCFVATFNEACDSCTASVKASACWSLNPAPLSLQTNLCVSNVNAGSAINQFSLPRILSRQPLTSSDEAAYIALNAEP